MIYCIAMGGKAAENPENAGIPRDRVDLNEKAAVPWDEYGL